MNFRSMKLWIPIVIYMLSIAPALAVTFSWSGALEVGQNITVSNLTLLVDQNNRTGQLALIVEDGSNILALIQGNGSTKVGNLTVSFIGFNGKGYITINGPELFTVGQPSSANSALLAKVSKLKAQVANLSRENEKLKVQVDSLKKENAQLKEKLKSQPNTAELKAELANLTNKYNQLKAKADFLEQQNEEYRQIIQQVMTEQSSEAKQSYIEKAKKEKLVGSVLLKGLTASLVVVGLVGYGLYRKKRSWEFGGL
uniref:T26-13p n=2 Tax=Thermococcus sp. 26/2 TaxID=758583 RepID=D6MY36_9EURY|nr:t26-13p [Thermococcus sp. 26/2]